MQDDLLGHVDEVVVRVVEIGDLLQLAVTTLPTALAEERHWHSFGKGGFRIESSVKNTLARCMQLPHC